MPCSADMSGRNSRSDQPPSCSTLAEATATEIAMAAARLMPIRISVFGSAVSTVLTAPVPYLNELPKSPRTACPR